MRRGLTLLVAVVALLAIGTAPARAAGQSALIDVTGSNVQTVINSEELSSLPATRDIPAALQMTQFTVERIDQGTYEATITVDGDYTSLGDDHITFVSVQVPGGPRERLALHGDGTATYDRAEGNTFVTVGEADIRIDGAALRFRLPETTRADTIVQPHILWPSGGLHAHAHESLVGVLAGEDLTQAFTGTGVRFENGFPVFHRLAEPMPADTLPDFIHIVETDDGLLVELNKPARTDGVTIKLYRGGFGLTDDPLLAWTAGQETPGVQELNDLLRISLKYSGPALTPEVPPAEPQLSPNYGPGPAVFTASGSCGSATFTGEVAIVQGNFSIRHGDGDVASGDIDLSTGRGTLRSASRGYEITTLDGTTFEATHTFQGCTYDVVGDLRDPVVRVEQPGAADNPGIPGTDYDLRVRDFFRVQVEADGLVAYTPAINIGALQEAGDGAATGGAGEPATDDEVPADEAAGAGAGAGNADDDDGGGLPVIPIAAGALAVAAGVGGGLLLKRRNDEGAVDCGPLLEKIAEVDRFLADQYARQAHLYGNLDASSREIELAAVQRFIDRNLNLRAGLAAQAEAAGCPVPPLPVADVDEFGFPLPYAGAAPDQSPVLTPTSTREKPGTGGLGPPIVVTVGGEVPPDFSDETYRQINLAMSELTLYFERPGTIVVDATNEDPPFESVDEVAGWDKLDKIGHVIGKSVSSGDAGDEFVRAVEELVPLIPIAVAVMIGAHVLVVPGLVLDITAFVLIFYALGSDFLDFVDTMNDAVKARNARELELARQRMARVLGRAGLDTVLALVTALQTIAKLGSASKAAEGGATKVPPRAPKNPELNKGGTYEALPGGGKAPGKNPALNKGGTYEALPGGGGKAPAKAPAKGGHDGQTQVGAKAPEKWGATADVTEVGAPPKPVATKPKPKKPAGPTDKTEVVPKGDPAKPWQSPEDKVWEAIETAKNAYNSARAEVPIRGALEEMARLKKGAPTKVPKNEAAREYYRQYIEGVNKAKDGQAAMGEGYWAQMDAEARAFLKGHVDNPLTLEQFLSGG